VDALTELARSQIQKENQGAAAKATPVRKSDWEKFQAWFTKASAPSLGIMSVVYLIWAQPGVRYPWPGEGFWTNEQVNQYTVMGLAAILAVSMMRPILTWTILMFVGALLVAALFGVW